MVVRHVGENGGKVKYKHVTRPPGPEPEVRPYDRRQYLIIVISKKEGNQNNYIILKASAMVRGIEVLSSVWFILIPQKHHGRFWTKGVASLVILRGI